MAAIVDYARVLDQMTRQGLKSLYHNSGAFGFPASTRTDSVGWIGPPDTSLRPAAQALAIQIPPPFERQLTQRVAAAWRDHLPGVVWLMPKSHWAYELDFGSPAWMPDLLASVGVDAALLKGRSDASAIEFAPEEIDPFSRLVEGLFFQLLGSDFALAFPGLPVVCTLHHHKQIWWTSTDKALISLLRQTT